MMYQRGHRKSNFRHKKTRKQRRKEERLAKKARKHQFCMNKSAAGKQKVSNEVQMESENILRPTVEKKRKRHRKPLTSSDVRKIQVQEAIAEDERSISRLEKQLKLKQKKNKIPKSFYDEGLGYLLEVVDQPKETLSVEKEVSDRINRIKQSRKKEEASSKNATFESEGEEMDFESGAENEESEDTEKGSDNDNSNSHDDGGGSDDDDDAPKKKKNKIWEDIYGRLRDEKGNVIKQGSENVDCGKYLPPAKRMTSSSEDTKKQELLKRMGRQMKGLLNRLSESNMQSVCSQIEEIYNKHSRNDANKTLSTLIMESVVSPVMTAERLVMEHAMLIALLHGNIGEEIGAHFLETLVYKLDELLNEKSNYGEGKMCDNLISLIIHFFTFRLTSSVLIYDILNKLIEKFQEKDLELILLILKSVGFALRKDNPSGLKQVILEIQKRAANVSPEQDQSRIRFMLETLTAIRNNNMYKIPNYDPSLAERMRKLLRTYLHKGRGIQEMRISYHDLLKAKQGGGRWWIVGSAWNNNAENTDQEYDNQKEATVNATNYSENLLRMAKAYKMNTDVRKAIFCIIASAEDYLDAFTRLMHLGLKSMQYREIIIVILDCCLQERTYNPYYAVLSEKFCNFDRKYRMTLQCAIWDKIRYLKELSPPQLNNLADFLLHCFVAEVLNITALKVMSFADLDSTTMKFLRRIFQKLLLKHSDEDCSKIFSKIPRDQKAFKESIRLFIIMFLDDKKEIVESKLSMLELSNKVS